MAHDDEIQRRVFDATAAPLLPLTSLVAGAVLLIAGGGGSTRGASALTPINQAALQATVDASARDLLVPGAVVLLRTPQGEFTATYGSVERGSTDPPGPDSHFRT